MCTFISCGKRGTNHTKKWLKRAICNHQWIDMCTSISISTLINNRSGHYPLILEFQLQDISYWSQIRSLRCGQCTLIAGMLSLGVRTLKWFVVPCSSWRLGTKNFDFRNDNKTQNIRHKYDTVSYTFFFLFFLFLSLFSSVLSVLSPPYTPTADCRFLPPHTNLFFSQTCSLSHFFLATDHHLSSLISATLSPLPSTVRTRQPSVLKW
jgi:hypothetical protein